MNNRFQNAARKWPGRAASGIRGGVGRAAAGMRGWQKAGLVLCVLFWILSAVIRSVCGRVTGRMADQNFAGRWSPGGGSAQVSTYLSDAAGISEDTVRALYSYFYTNLNNDSIALSETQIENGASLIDACYCGIGSAEIGAGEESLTVTAIGAGGDFFNFHPLEMIDGHYFSQDDLMKDRVLLDDETAWRLFGSPYITGKSILIGGAPHYVAGVFKRPDGRFYKAAGMGNFLIYLSYDSFCRYTEAGAASPDGGSEPDDSSFEDASAMPRDGLKIAETLPSAAVRVPAQDNAADVFAMLRTDFTTAQVLPSAASRVSPGDELPDVLPVLTDAAEDAPDVLSALPGAAEEKPGPGAGDSPEEQRQDVAGGGIFVALSDDDGDTEEAGSSDAGGSGDALTEEADDSSMKDDAADEKDEPNADGWTKEPVGDDDSEPKETINWNRISCYEVVLPNPISEYALRMVRSALTELSVDMDQAEVIENTSRFDVFRLVLMIAEPGVRSMQTAPIRYPYWENVALAWEDVLVPYALLQLVLRYSPILFLFFMLVWYMTHKSWTLGGIAGTIRDRIYDRQSERIYGKRSAGELPLESGTPAQDAPEDDGWPGGGSTETEQ